MTSKWFCSEENFHLSCEHLKNNPRIDTEGIYECSEQVRVVCMCL